MRLYHGSNMEIEKVDLSKCMPNKDFGCGFYTTLLEEQAWRMAQRRVRIDCGRLTNQYTFHTEKALQYLKKVGVMHDKSAARND